MTPVDTAPIIRTVLERYALPVRGPHGVLHWARVLENGLRLAETTGADIEVVTLFALFHDSRRFSENRDPGHGLRGGELARSLRGDLVRLDDDRFDVLHEACRLHTDGLNHENVTIQVCWDADRLDLGRVGIRPIPGRLCTDAARALIPWAHARALKDEEPGMVGTVWRV
jgi:uncharacterized protein